MLHREIVIANYLNWDKATRCRVIIMLIEDTRINIIIEKVN